MDCTDQVASVLPTNDVTSSLGEAPSGGLTFLLEHLWLLMAPLSVHAPL